MMQLMFFRVMQGLSFYPNEEDEAFSGNAGGFPFTQMMGSMLFRAMQRLSFNQNLKELRCFFRNPHEQKIADHFDLLSSKLFIY
jgi:hypothetical protein